MTSDHGLWDYDPTPTAEQQFVGGKHFFFVPQEQVIIVTSWPYQCKRLESYWSEVSGVVM